MTSERVVAMKALENQFRSLQNEPTGYFKFELKDEDVFEWYIYMNGTCDTCYEGGIFKLELKWPDNYPFMPPTLYVLSDFWHPNVHDDGKVCISILHPPGDDPMSGERPEERWLPIHTAETIMLSFMSMLADPNCSSPANVDSGVQYRRDRKAYNARVKKLAEKAKRENSKVTIPPQRRRFIEPKFDSLMDDEDGNMEYVLASDESDIEEEGEGVFSPDSDDYPMDSDDIDIDDEDLLEEEGEEVDFVEDE